MKKGLREMILMLNLAFKTIRFTSDHRVISVMAASEVARFPMKNIREYYEFVVSLPDAAR